tara:strand:- start:218 stop:529 length:312 start_codon:yes stop_codon:yes gene_type:complete
MKYDDIITKLLTEKPRLKDDDHALLANIWWLRVSDTMLYKLSPEEMEGVKKFLGEIANKNMPDSESIRRTRRKLQEQNPELRGKLWEKRQAHAKTVAKEIHNW